MSTIFSETDYNQTSESGRLQVWTRGVGYVLGHPLLGVGANNFTAAEGLLSPFAGRQQYGVGVRWSAPHNTFLQIAAELGLPGLLFFVAMFVAAFRALKRWPSRLVDARGRPPISPALKQALRASLIGFIVGSFFLSLAYAELLYTLIALAIGVSKVEWRFRRSLARA
jgi:O-antigen ligase